MSDEPEQEKGPPDPREAYTPFSPPEIKRLQRYVDRVHAFEQTDFARVETIGLTLTGEVGKETTATVSGFTDQVLKQALMELRPLWLQEEVAGFQQSQAVVKRRAYKKGTDAGREAIEHVRNHTRYLDSILNGPTPIQLREIRVAQNGQVVNQEEVTPRRIFEDFLNGVYFHEDEDRLARIGAWLHTEVQRYIFREYGPRHRSRVPVVRDDRRRHPRRARTTVRRLARVRDQEHRMAEDPGGVRRRVVTPGF